VIRCMLFIDRGGNSPITEWEVLGRIDISNDFLKTIETDGRRGNYAAVIYKKRPRAWKRVKVKEYPRMAYHSWELIRLILNKAAEQNKGHM